MSTFQSLTADQLRRGCAVDTFSFETTAELEETGEVVGQDRAQEAIEFGVGIKRRGYNLFALGPVGTGKHYFVNRFLVARAKEDPVPLDICYMHNFEQPFEPSSLVLEPGRGKPFKKQMDRLATEMFGDLEALYQSDEYRARRQALMTATRTKRDQAVDEIRRRASEESVAVIQTPESVALAPMHDGHIIDDDAFDELAEEERTALETALARYREELEATAETAARWERDGRRAVRDLEREQAFSVVGSLVAELRDEHTDHPEIVHFLDDVERDVIENAAHLVARSISGQGTEVEDDLAKGVGLFFRRYRVNLLVDHGDSEGAPVVYEDNPTVANLFGSIESKPTEGGMTSDFTLVRAGAFHKARGGYLILDAHRVLREEESWEHIKRTLRSGELAFNTERGGGTETIKPKSIPNDVKVVLVGPRRLYHYLTEEDPDFPELFKVAVDFEESLLRDEEGVQAYARLIGTLVRQEKLRHLERAAVARIVELAARQARHQTKLSTRVRWLYDLLGEADYWAGTRDSELITVKDVDEAVVAFVRRHARLRDRLHDEIDTGSLKIAVDGEVVGQINALQVLMAGEFTFGCPGRLTASVWLGRGDVIDIEREVELGGALHSKGVMILTGFLGSRFGGGRPLAVSASLVFEQSYSLIDGDSASMAETCALLSALAEVPIYQGLGVTGSMDQRGQVQAIGEVNEKIEGFFDVCVSQGLTGDQGVIIPEANVDNLMLRREVVEAVRDGKFHVFSVKTVDEAMAVLTGREVGTRDRYEPYPEGTVNARVDKRLAAFAELSRSFLGGHSAR